MIIRIITLTLLLLTVCGCSSIDLEQAQVLAAEGNSTSLQIAELYQRSSNDIDSYIEGEYLMSILKDGFTPPDTETRQQLEIVKKQLVLRQLLFEELAKAYQALGTLAKYDASVEMQASLARLNTMLDKHSSSKPAVIIRNYGEDLTPAGVFILSSYHQALVSNANIMLLEQLKRIHQLLENEKERRALSATYREIAQGRLRVVEVLWDNHLGVPVKLLEEYVESYGMEFDKTKLMGRLESPAPLELKKNIKKFLQFRKEKELKLNTEAYNASIGAVDSLVKTHLQLAKGEDISLQSTQLFLMNLRKISEHFNQRYPK